MITLKKNEGYNALYKFNAPKGVPLVPLQFTREQTKLKEYEMLLPIGIKKTLVGRTFDLKRRIIIAEFEIDYNASVDVYD